MARVLILAPKGDSHATPVMAVLSRQGHEVHRFGLDGYPFSNRQSIAVGPERPLTFGSPELCLDSALRFDTVWIRRVVPPTIHPEVLGVELEQDDGESIRTTHTYYLHGVFALLANRFAETKDAFWINRLEAVYRGENKLMQLELARDVGLNLPDTLVTNDPAEVAKFREKYGAVICKALCSQTAYLDDEGRTLLPLSAVLPIDYALPDDSVLVSPTIFQNYIEKSYEIRTLFLGEHHFSVRIESQSDPRTRVDWRVRPDRMTPYVIPDELAQCCRELMDRLSLRSASFDFIRDPSGRYVFLELNQAGQFLFLELFCPQIKLLDAFCHYIVHHDLTDWDEREATATLFETSNFPEVRAARRDSDIEVAEIAQKTGKAVRRY